MIFRRRSSADGTGEPAYAEPGYDQHAAQYVEDGLLHAGPPAGAPPADGTDADGGYVPYADVLPHLQELARLQEERAALVELCLYARDRVNSPAAAERIDARLVELGITPLRPDGQPFDPAEHEAATGVPTDDPALHGRVAETEVPGYADHGRVVRPPVVSVYRREQA
jgi:molecular chaperone GrpE